MLCLVFLFFYACSSNTSSDTASTTSETKSADSAAAPAKKGPAELLDMSLAEPMRASFTAFTKGDIDGFTSEFADNVKYYWSGGDSAIGKQAAKDYWTGRWKLIDSLSHSDDIYLPIQVNESQTPLERTGKYLLHWTLITVKYKNGKKLTFWLHNVNHYNDAGKIDEVVSFYDRAPIVAATKGLVAK
jgi:hypothetical protein